MDRIGFFDERYAMVDDMEMVFRISRLCRWVGTRKPLVIFHDTPGSFSKRSKKWRRDMEVFLETYGNIVPRRERAHWLLCLGKQRYREGDICGGYMLFVRALLVFPLSMAAIRKVPYHFPRFLYQSLKRRH